MNVWNDLLGNVALLIISTSIWTFGHQHLPKMRPWLKSATFGLIMAIGTICVMNLRFQFIPGVLLDLRYAFIAIAGFFGGPIAVVLPTVTALVWRTILGGTGMWVGLPQIAVAAAVGMAGFHIARGRIPNTRSMVAFGAAVACSGVGGFFLVTPFERWPSVMPQVVAPFSCLLFAAAFIAAQAIAHEMRRQKTSAENRMYRAVIEALPDCLNAKDIEGRFLIANPATAALMGAEDAKALIGHTDFDFYPPVTAREFRAPEIDLMASGTSTTCEQRFNNADGGVSWLSTLKAPLRDDDGEVIGIITHNREITAQKLMEQELARTQRRLADAIASMADGFAMFDDDGIQVFCNARYHKLFPKTADVRINGTGLRCIIRAGIERGEELAVVGDIDNVVERTFAALTTQGDRQMRLADGRWINARTRRTEEGGCLIVYSDVTRAKEADAHLRTLNQRLEAMALHDGLTGLLNRRAFDIELDAAVHRAKGGAETFSLLMIDVDHFKAFNDTYGHPAGDDCLKVIGNCVRSALEPYVGAQVARYGGEEVAVILPHAQDSEANSIARLVVSAVRALGLAHEGSEKAIVTVSIGVAGWEYGMMTSIADVLIAADKGLYAAKASGRDCVKAIASNLPQTLAKR